MRYRIESNPVMMQLRGKTNLIVAIMTEPVIHAIAKPGAIVYHIQRTSPQVEAFSRCTDVVYINMATKEKVSDTSMIQKSCYPHENEKNKYIYQQYFALANRNGSNKNGSDSDGYPGAN